MKDQQDNKIGDGERRPLQEVSDKHWALVCRTVGRLFQEGDIGPNLDDSLLGLDWSLFRPRTFPEQEGDTTLITPPEFRVYAFSALDAYVTALLDADTFYHPGGTINCTCSLRQDATGGLDMELKTDPSQANAGSRRVMIELLNSFPSLLRARKIEAKEVSYLKAGHCMKFAYPGHMVVSLSPYLRDRPLELWPSVTLSLPVSDELVTRASMITEFLRDHEAGGHVVN